MGWKLCYQKAQTKDSVAEIIVLNRVAISGEDGERLRASTPLVVIFKSGRKLSVFAWVRFPRSRFKAEKLTAAGGESDLYGKEDK